MKDECDLLKAVNDLNVFSQWNPFCDTVPDQPFTLMPEVIKETLAILGCQKVSKMIVYTFNPSAAAHFKGMAWFMEMC